MMTRVPKFALGLTVVLALAGTLSAGGGVNVDLAKMQGTWQFVSHEMAGKKITGEDAKKMTVTIKGDTWTVKMGDAVLQAGTQKLDSTKDPKFIDAKVTEGENKGTTMLGIYKIDGDNLTVCFDTAGKSRPKAFKLEPDTAQFLAVAKRLAK